MNNEAGGATFFFDLPLGLESGEVICQPKPYINELITPDVDLRSTLPRHSTSLRRITQCYW